MDPNHKTALIASLIGIPAAIVAGVIVWGLTDGLRGDQASPPSSTSQSEESSTPPTDDSSIVAEPDEDESTSIANSTSPSILFLRDLSDDQIVKKPHWVWESDGTASIAGTSYLNSVIYEFQNCSNCDESLEVLVPAGYTTLTGVVGLGDLSRHDDVIDGIVNFAVYDASGNQIFATQQIEYPQALPIAIDITGQPRIRIEMSRGTNYEQFVLGDAAFVRAGA